MFKVVKIMFVLCLWIVWSVALDDHFRIVDDPQSSNLFEFNGDRFQDSVQNSTGPIFLWSVLGLPKSGKSAFANALVHVSRFLNNAQGESSAEDAFDASGWWSQRESMIAAPVPRSDGGIDLFLDMEGSRFGSYSEQTWKLPLIAACASSSPIIFLTNEFNDQTFHMISSLSVRLKYGIGTECSFREGGPSMVVIINSHDAALRQEQEPGGLEAVWQKIAESVPEEAQAKTSIVLTSLILIVEVQIYYLLCRIYIRLSRTSALWHCRTSGTRESYET